ncbi:MAG: nucleotidyl transferase AbiEii/AbiGii toxin family protein [Patescibacteria group bacterium]
MHEESLTKQAARIFPSFANFKNFYLAGGTALAIQIGHRKSVDFDFFSSRELPSDLMGQVKKTFSHSQIAITYSAVSQLNLLIDDIKTTFLEYPYPVLESFVKQGKVAMASIPEIAAMKAHAIGRRLSYKDYIDWYFLLKEKHITLSKLIPLAQKKFGGEFSDRLFLGQLVSLVDIPTQPIDFLRDEVGRETIRKFLESEVKKIKL